MNIFKYKVGFNTCRQILFKSIGKAFKLEKMFCTNVPTSKERTPEEYEKEWTKMYLEIQKKNKEFLESELSETEKEEVKFLTDKFLELSKEERLYFLYVQRMLLIKYCGVDPKRHLTSPSIAIEGKNLWPKENPDWLKTQSLMQAIGAFQGRSILGSGPSPSQTEGKKEEKPKEEKKVEKKEVEIKLMSFAADKKVLLIKEVKGMLNLGLKEAKEMVEKAPVSLRKDVKREEAEGIKKKLSEFGGIIELV
jgi:large subunit ribosomal protein L7/L12